MLPATRLPFLILLCLGLLALSSCVAPVGAPSTKLPSSTAEIIIYDWFDDIPEQVFEAFTEEYGVKVRYLSYESQEEAIEQMNAGELFDIVVLDSQFIPGLAEKQLITPINYQNVPNFKYISANFRDLVYDPGNRYSIPYNWGTTGLVARSDLVEGPVTRWSDLWKQENAGKVLLWRGVQRQMTGMALKSLGYSANSEDPAELEAALERLLTLRPNVIFGEDQEESQETSAPILLSGEAVMAVGWAHDVLEARADNPAVTYVLPEEGALLWGDNFVLPSNSKNQAAAELLLNFLLRPEISAQMTDYNSYPSASEKARDFVGADLMNDPLVYPKNEDLRNAEIILPLSPAGEKLHNDIWERFLAAP